MTAKMMTMMREWGRDEHHKTSRMGCMWDGVRIHVTASELLHTVRPPILVWCAWGFASVASRLDVCEHGSPEYSRFVRSMIDWRERKHRKRCSVRLVDVARRRYPWVPMSSARLSFSIS